VDDPVSSHGAERNTLYTFYHWPYDKYMQRPTLTQSGHSSDINDATLDGLELQTV